MEMVKEKAVELEMLEKEWLEWFHENKELLLEGALSAENEEMRHLCLRIASVVSDFVFKRYINEKQIDVSPETWTEFLAAYPNRLEDMMK